MQNGGLDLIAEYERADREVRIVKEKQKIFRVMLSVLTAILAFVLLYRYFYLGVESKALFVAVAVLSIANLTMLQHRS